MTRPEIVIAWDFDGVLNANVKDGRFIWADHFESDTGQSREGFVAHVFGKSFDAVITGQEDLRGRVAAWASSVGYDAGPDALIDYWFGNDFYPDQDILALCDQVRAKVIRNIMATNNEPRRTALIKDHPEFGSRIERIFASGHLGVRKPDTAFFTAVTCALSVEPSQMILVDDAPENVDAARLAGWDAHLHRTDDFATTQAFLTDRIGSLE